MESKSKVLTIGTDTSEIEPKVQIPKKSIYFFKDDFKDHLQKILLNGANPIGCDPIKRLAANEVKKNGQYYYEFAPHIRSGGWIINGPTFEPKGILRRIKDRISKDHWTADNVAKYTKDSRDFIQKTVSEALHEEQFEIYQYICYLMENPNKK